MIIWVVITYIGLIEEILFLGIFSIVNYSKGKSNEQT